MKEQTQTYWKKQHLKDALTVAPSANDMATYWSVHAVELSRSRKKGLMTTKKSKKKISKKTTKATVAKRTPVPPAPSTLPRVEGGTPISRKPVTARSHLLGTSDKTTNQRVAALNAAINKINTDYGENSVVPASMANANSYLRRPSGIMQLDIDTGGGLPAASLCTIGGPDNCIAGDTFVRFETRRKDGKRNNHKGGSIKRLYERFHEEQEVYDFTAPSMNDEGHIIQNQIDDVVYAGYKECLAITTKTGRRIVATPEHLFFTGTGYTKLGNLQRGDSVFIHANTVKTRTEPKKSTWRPDLCLPRHPNPNCSEKLVKQGGKTYTYKRIEKSRAVVEAAMNGLTLQEYINLLKGHASLANLKFLRSEEIVHHEDENFRNDTLRNLVITTRAEHMLTHLKDRDRENYFRFMVTEDKIISIKPAGKLQTYDIRMHAPYHNFIANDLVVHNSGKSTLLYHYYAMHQRLYGQDAFTALASTEGSIDYIQARRCGWVIPVPWSVIEATNASLEAAGMPKLNKEQVDELRREVGQNTIIEASTMEEILDIVERSLRSNLYGIIGIDSYDAMLPKGEAELDSYEDNAQRALRASLITRFFLNYGPIKKSNGHFTTFLMTTQVRSNPAKAAAKGPMAQYIKPYTGSGSAYSLKHRRDIDIVLDVGERHKEGSRSKEEKIDKRPIIGKDVTWHLEKGKSGAHDNVRGKTPYYYDTRCFNILHTVVMAGLKYGVIREEEGRLTFYPNTLLPDGYLYRIPGPEQFMQAMQEEPESEWALRRAICLAAKVSATYR